MPVFQWAEHAFFPNLKTEEMLTLKEHRRQQLIKNVRRVLNGLTLLVSLALLIYSSVSIPY